MQLQSSQDTCNLKLVTRFSRKRTKSYSQLTVFHRFARQKMRINRSRKTVNRQRNQHLSKLLKLVFFLSFCVLVLFYLVTMFITRLEIRSRQRFVNFCSPLQAKHFSSVPRIISKQSKENGQTLIINIYKIHRCIHKVNLYNDLQKTREQDQLSVRSFP